jgi:Secretion system C-terminal sorting domain
VQTQPIPRPSTGIYPNPVATILNIVTELPFAEQFIISVYDATGKLVLQNLLQLPTA